MKTFNLSINYTPDFAKVGGLPLTADRSLTGRADGGGCVLLASDEDERLALAAHYIGTWLTVNPDGNLVLHAQFTNPFTITEVVCKKHPREVPGFSDTLPNMGALLLPEYSGDEARNAQRLDDVYSGAAATKGINQYFTATSGSTEATALVHVDAAGEGAVIVGLHLSIEDGVRIVLHEMQREVAEREDGNYSVNLFGLPDGSRVIVMGVYYVDTSKAINSAEFARFTHMDEVFGRAAAPLHGFGAGDISFALASLKRRQSFAYHSDGLTGLLDLLGGLMGNRR